MNLQKALRVSIRRFRSQRTPLHMKTCVWLSLALEPHLGLALPSMFPQVSALHNHGHILTSDFRAASRHLERWRIDTVSALRHESSEQAAPCAALSEAPLMAAASGAEPAPECCGPAAGRMLESRSQLDVRPFAAGWPGITEERTVSNCMHMVPGKTDMSGNTGRESTLSQGRQRDAAIPGLVASSVATAAPGEHLLCSRST